MSKNGLVVDGEGWFVVNARESRWKDEGPLGSYCTFEGKRRFPHFGINISVLDPFHPARQLRVQGYERVCLQLRECNGLGVVGLGPAQLLRDVPGPTPQHGVAEQADRH